MLFELRNAVPEVSNEWIEARDLFLDGQVRPAFELARSMRGKVPLRTANDYLLNIEIARACSVVKTYMALVRRAMWEFSDDPLVQLYHSRVLLTLSRQTEGIKYLLDCEQTLGRTHRAYWGTELANMYASAGFEKSCIRWLETVQHEPDFDSPLCLYSRSCAREGLQQWDEAIERAERCIAVAPNWSRVRGYLAHCLLARGRVDAAEQQIAEVRRRGHQEAIVDVAAAMLPLSAGRFEEARPRLQGLLADWPQADFVKWVRRTLCILLVELRDYEQAREIAAGDEEKLALPKIPEQPVARHHYIPLPLIAQNRNQCVPTSVAMAVHPQGGRFDPDVMFREMHGREGTSLWRMRQWCLDHGYRVVPIRLEKEAITTVLAAGFPMIGSLQGPFNSHVEVVCGFNDDLDTLYVRDPGHWALVPWPWEIALRRYRMHAGLLAVIEESRTDALQMAEGFRSDDCEALLDLSYAVANADREGAEAAYHKISDDSPAAVLRDGYAANVAISPLRFRERMKSVSQDESADMVARFRAVMSLGSDDDGVLDKLLDDDRSDAFRAAARRYLRLLRTMNEGDWPTAAKLIEQMLRRGCGVAQFWEIKSDILAELGQHDASRDALERAIELEPFRMSTREKALNRSASKLTLDEYAAELESLLAEDPDDKGLLVSRAALLQDGPDGKAYEQAARETIRWYPRMPGAYLALLNWYRFQSRMDLHDTLLEEAKQLLPDIFGDDEEPNADAGNAEVTSPDDGKPTAKERPSCEVASGDEETLPDDKDALLNLVWQVNDRRRESALQRAIEMQQTGQLRWYEVARLVACRLLVPDQKAASPADPDTLLPDSPPGAPHWFASSLCDIVTDFEPSIRTALAIDRWILRVVPNYQDYSELWFNRVLILEHAGQMESAIEELRKLLDRYPATSSALYRMGVVRFRQQDFSAAREYFEKALQVNPGLIGAMEMLRDVYETLGQPEECLRCTRMLRRKMPYSTAYLRDEILAVATQESPAAAEQLLDQAASDFPTRRIDVLRARMMLETDRVDEAGKLLDPIELSPDDDDDSFELCLGVKLQLALLRQDTEAVIGLCDSGLARWPDSTRLMELKAEQLFRSDPQQSRELLCKLMYEGEPRAETAWQFLQLAGDRPDRAAKQVVQQAPEDRRLALAELFSEVMSHPELLQFNEPYLKWALDQFPDSDLLRHRLASHYNVNGKPKLAVRLAQELYDRNPEAPEAARMLGRCLIDRDAKKALPYLEQVCQQNRSAEYLFDLARCHQMLGNGQRSQELHWEILELNPYVAASWTNLFIFGASRERLWPYLTGMLERGFGGDDEYFLVAAVRIALELKQTLPTSWFPIGAQRWVILQTHPGYKNERPQLKRALLAWRSKRPQDVQPNMHVPASFAGSLVARMWWPGQAWIPTA